MTDKNLSALRVLIVDDSRLIIKLMPAMLGRLGITQVDSAANAAEAEAKIAVSEYDIVFLDWRMPGKSGLELLEECKKDTRYANVAFVIVSGGTDEAQIDKVFQAGAAEYIIKPFDAAMLDSKMEKIVAWLESHGRMKP